VLVRQLQRTSPPVAGGGIVAEAEAMEVVAGPGAGTGRGPSTPPPGNAQQEDAPDSSGDSSWDGSLSGSDGSSPDVVAVVPKCRPTKTNFHELRSGTSMRDKCISMVKHMVRPGASEEEKFLAVGVFCQHLISYTLGGADVSTPLGALV